MFLTFGPLDLHFPPPAAARCEVTSDATSEYNCLAWAVGDEDSWWAPIDGDGISWPDHLPREWTRETVQAALATAGYEPCQDGALIDGVEKAALYADEENITHIARQLPDGRWTSKLGSDCDIEHDLEALEGFDDGPGIYRYGRVVAFMSRPRRLGNEPRHHELS